LNSRNICPNPIDSLKEYKASEKEICYEADNEGHCLARSFFRDWLGADTTNGSLMTELQRPYRTYYFAGMTMRKPTSQDWALNSYFDSGLI
jgi:hypothetical protein